MGFAETLSALDDDTALDEIVLILTFVSALIKYAKQIVKKVADLINKLIIMIRSFIQERFVNT